jgi:hypothetical protein
VTIHQQESHRRNHDKNLAARVVISITWERSSGQSSFRRSDTTWLPSAEIDNPDAPSEQERVVDFGRGLDAIRHVDA